MCPRAHVVSNDSKDFRNFQSIIIDWNRHSLDIIFQYNRCISVYIWMSNLIILLKRNACLDCLHLKKKNLICIGERERVCDVKDKIR